VFEEKARQIMNEISLYLPGLILAYSAFLLAIASPGPNVLAILGTSMASGRKAGLALALGIAAGSFCWAMLTFSGLSALLASYAEALAIIKIAGGMYLLLLAVKALRSAAATRDIETAAHAVDRINLFRYFQRGLLVQMTNPKAALAWIAIFSLGLQTNAPSWVGISLVLGTSLLSLLIHLLYALAFSTEVMARAYGRARRWIQAALGGLFAFAGIKLLLSRS
jgi:threonine/homoserine/homoserine lactone efflux protein